MAALFLGAYVRGVLQAGQQVVTDLILQEGHVVGRGDLVADDGEGDAVLGRVVAVLTVDGNARAGGLGRD